MVNEGEVYRIANVHTGNGISFVERGVFLDNLNNLISPIPDNSRGSIPYSFNDVVIPRGATKMLVNFYYEMQSRVDTINSISVNKAVEPIVHYGDIQKLKYKKWAAYGDSITYYADWVRMVENATNLKVYINGYGGASITTKVAGNNLCDDDRIDALLNTDADIITIMGGLNDGNSVELGSEDDFKVSLGSEDKSTFYGAYAYIVKRILIKKPEAKIMLLTTTFGNYNNNNGETSPMTSLDYAIATKEVAEYFGLTIVNLRQNMQLNGLTQDLLSADNVHLSMRGAESLAGVVLREFKNINWISH